MRDHQMRTIAMYNMDKCNGWDCIDNMWPIVQPTQTIPKRIARFRVSEAGGNGDAFCHFYLNDYLFERIWRHPEKYVDTLRQYAGVIAPDFSTYTDMPYPMQMWNVYRSRALAHYWQACGLDVIANIQFSDMRSMEWCFDGMPKRSVLALSSVGVSKNSSNRFAFKRGAEEACRVLEPTAVVCYGPQIDFRANGATIYRYESDNNTRVRKWFESRDAEDTE